MHPEDHGDGVEAAGVEYRLPPAFLAGSPPLLGRLGDEANGAGQPVADLAQRLRRRRHRSRVTAVAAGMQDGERLAWVVVVDDHGGEVDPGLFLHGQDIPVGMKSHHPLRRLASTNDPMTP